MVNEQYDVLWSTFAKQEGLSDLQLSQFKRYYELLTQWNEKTNLTAIEDLAGILSYHFQDSLILDRFVPMNEIKGTADVGTGGGFPGIPLKIKYPHLFMVLIEVNNKKRDFLQKVVDEFGLEQVVISDLDWRTFIRKTSYPIELFCARASLHPDELVRILKPSSWYKDAEMVYWASAQWQPEAKEVPFISRKESYSVGDRNRQLIFFKSINEK